MPSKIRKGDTVVVLAGKDKGKQGAVIEVMPKKNRVLVRSVNMVKRHSKPTQTNPQGGIIDKEAPLHVSNVALIDPSDNKPTRAGFKEEDGKMVRISRRTGTVIPLVTE